MCGIVALWDPALPTSERADVARTLAHRLRHRGPDGEGTWTSPVAPVALAHRRLAIRGLGDVGAQPMVSANGASALTFNGELFGTESLQRELEETGVRFRGTCDTDLLLHALLRWGVPGALGRVRGQFAFAFFDASTRAVYFARDRVGIRPVMFSRSGDKLAIASEQKALLPLAWVDRTPSRAGALRYLALQRTDDVPFETLVSGIRSLPAGHWGSWDGRELKLARYDRVDDAPPIASTEDVRRELDRAVDEQLVSDVPVGAMVSGGLDSSTVALLADRARVARGVTEPMHLFAYHDTQAEADEREYQQAVIDAFRSPKRVHWVSSSPAELRAGFERYVDHQEEPYGDVSSFAEYTIAAHAARVGVKVLLGGLGGDEVFVGYPSYIGPLALDLVEHGDLRSAMTLMRTAPEVTQGSFGARQVAMAAAYHAAPSVLRNVLTALRASRAGGLGPGLAVFAARDAIRTWHRHEGRGAINGALRGSIESWSIPRFLAHSDRMCLAWGVEGRVPLLDDGVIRAAFGVRPRDRVSLFGLKASLRAAVADVLPPVVRDRAWKLGFHAPVGAYVAAIDEPLRAGLTETARLLGTSVAWDSLSVFARWRWGMLGCYLRWIVAGSNSRV